MSYNSYKLHLTLAFLALVFTFTSNSAQAQTYYACVSVNGANKELLKRVNSPADCSAPDILMHWNEKGDKGDAGVQGIQGIQGTKGDTGAPGAQGEKGDKGANGNNGANGIDGAAGQRGDRGDKGDTGAAGTHGEKGEKGDNGVNGTDGAPGLQGEKGATGAHGEKGEKGNNGRSVNKVVITPHDSAWGYWATAGNGGEEQCHNGAILLFYDTNENGVNEGQPTKVCHGTKGEKGDRGDAGEKGDKGDTGATGNQGEKGEKGDKGDKGESSTTGNSFELYASAGNQNRFLLMSSAYGLLYTLCTNQGIQFELINDTSYDTFNVFQKLPGQEITPFTLLPGKSTPATDAKPAAMVTFLSSAPGLYNNPKPTIITAWGSGKDGKCYAVATKTSDIIE